MKYFYCLLIFPFLLIAKLATAQDVDKESKPAKVLHAEPLYIDLIRDLGARKGEREWNIGLGLTDNLFYDTYVALVEYEFAPVNRLGFEIELPFLIYAPAGDIPKDSIPGSKAESLKLATQWSFLVDSKNELSMALGYINELEFSDFQNFGNPLFTGNIFNPFLVVAKRLGSNFHSLIYAGPQVTYYLESGQSNSIYEVHTNLHYMIKDSRNFIGIEFNKYFDGPDFDMTIRPQMRLDIVDEVMIGVVTGIPISRENERLSMFLRIIWEPQDH